MNRKQQIKDLWQICFDDTEEFIRFYFDKVYKDEQALSIEKDGKVIAALQMIPYRMTWLGQELTVSYISGACTLPEERGKGVMRELLGHAIEKMRQTDVDLTALIPADHSLFEYYRVQGYVEVFDYSLHTFYADKQEDNSSALSFVPLNEDAPAEWFDFFDRKLRERTTCILHSRNDFQNIITDTFIGKGLVTGLLDEQKKPVGIIFSEPNGDKAFVKELVYEDDRVKENLLRHASSLHAVPQILYKTPADFPDSRKYGMAMVLNTEKMIQHWLQQNPSSQPSAGKFRFMDIQSLTQLLLGYEKREAYMSLMLD